MKTVKGPAVYLAQFMDTEKPFNSLDGLCEWAADLGYKGMGNSFDRFNQSWGKQRLLRRD